MCAVIFFLFMVPDRNWYCKSIARDLLCHCTGCRECGSACTDSLPAERNYLTGESNCFHSCELLHARYHLHMQVLLQRLGSSWLKLVGPPPHITIYFRGRSKDFQGGESRLTKRHYLHLEQNICTTTKNDLRVFCCSNHGWITEMFWKEWVKRRKA